MQASSMQHSHGCNANVDAVPQQEHTQQRWRWGSGQQQPVSSRSPYSAQPAPHGPPCLSAARLPGRRRRQAWPQARPTACRPPAKATSQRSTGMSSDQAAQNGSEQWRARAVREAGSLRGWGCAIWGANSRAQVPAVAWEAHGEAPPSGSSTVGACGRRSRHHCKDVNCPAHLCLIQSSLGSFLNSFNPPTRGPLFPAPCPSHWRSPRSCPAWRGPACSKGHGRATQPCRPIIAGAKVHDRASQWHSGLPSHRRWAPVEVL